MEYQSTDGSVLVLTEMDEGDATTSEALKQRQEKCIAAGGVFLPNLNQCCSPEFVSSPGYKPGDYCGDPIKQQELIDENKSQQNWVLVGIALGSVALIGGVAWWMSTKSSRSPNPTEDPHDLDVLARHGEKLTQEDVAKNPRATPSTLRFLARLAIDNSDVGLMEALLMNPGLPSEVQYNVSNALMRIGAAR